MDYWQLISLGFLCSFSLPLLYMIRRAKERKAPVAITIPMPDAPPFPSPSPFERELESARRELSEKNALLLSLEEENRGLASTSQTALKTKTEELLHLTHILHENRALLAEKEAFIVSLQEKIALLQEKNSDLHLEIETLMQATPPKEEKELFFFFSEEEATPFIHKKQKEAIPYLKHSQESLQGWVENEKEGFLLLFSKNGCRILASNLPLFHLFTKNKEEWLRLNNEGTPQKMECGDTIFVFKKVDPIEPSDPIYLATAYQTLLTG